MIKYLLIEVFEILELCVIIIWFLFIVLLELFFISIFDGLKKIFGKEICLKFYMF